MSGSTFLAFIGLAVVLGWLQWGVLAAYTLFSVMTYWAYTADKRAAELGNRRTREGTLLFLGLAGGWPGALFAQHQLRHKTRKLSFQAAFWLTVALNCAGLVGLSPAMHILQMLLERRQVESLKNFF